MTNNAETRTIIKRSNIINYIFFSILILCVIAVVALKGRLYLSSSAILGMVFLCSGPMCTLIAFREYKTVWLVVATIMVSFATVIALLVGPLYILTHPTSWPYVIANSYSGYAIIRYYTHNR